VPPERWSPAQVAALAPDASSLTAARAVGPWPATGLLDDILWGLCRSYQVAVDLSGPAYTCSCPSRKIPCKHALGLLMVWADGGTGAADPPPWVAEWQAARAARAARPVRAPGAPAADPAAAQKRAAQRVDRVAAGMTELRQWLGDQVEQGLAGFAASGHRPFEAMAARLVDAQAPAAASAVRRLGAIAGVGPQWADRMLGELSMLWLLTGAWERLGDLPPALASTVRTRIGFPVAADEVLAGPRLRDRWQVLGQIDTDDGALMSRRVWLHGADTGRFALLLTFAAPGESLGTDTVPGTEVDADLCFYPGAWPMRALIADRHGPAEPVATPAGAAPLAGALERWAATLAAEPWRFDTPVLLSGVVPSADGRLVDRSGDALPLAPGHREPWWLLAAAGAHPATVAAEWSPSGLRPLSAWVDGHYVPAAPGIPEFGVARPAELPGELLAAALVGTARKPWLGSSVAVGSRSLDVSGPPVAAGSRSLDVSGSPVAAGGRSPEGFGSSDSVGGGSLEAAESPAPPDGRSLEAAGSSVAVGDRSAGPAGSSVSVGGRAVAGPGALLEAAAAALIYRRAGVRPGTGHEAVAPAPAETGPPLPAPAGARLLRILSDGSQVSQELLQQWLALAAGHGGHAPPEALPALFDAGRRNAAIRPALGRVAGRRGTWLAAMRADWRWLLDEAPGLDASDDPAVWETGAQGERLAYLTHLRQQSPETARELLDRTWTGESAEDRVRLLAALETGLSPADEEFLERALDDRRHGVRDTALELLRRIPGSGLRDRMAARARAAVRLERNGLGRERLAVTVPEQLDPGLRRDGVGATPIRGAGVSAWLLEEIVAGTTLSVWTSDFDRSPAAVLELARGHDWEMPLVHGWAKAAITQQDDAWVTALVAAEAGLRDVVRWMLYQMLPPDELARIAADFLRREDHLANRLLTIYTGEWTQDLAVTVIETIARRAREDRHSWQLSELCRTAALAMPPRYAPHIARLAEHLGQEPTDTSRLRPVADLARTLTFRHEMHLEFE
jgi:hypothetical protein